MEEFHFGDFIKAAKEQKIAFDCPSLPDEIEKMANVGGYFKIENCPPCPFCGRDLYVLIVEALDNPPDLFGGWEVTCGGKCKLHMGLFKNREEAESAAKDRV